MQKALLILKIATTRKRRKTPVMSFCTISGVTRSRLMVHFHMQGHIYNFYHLFKNKFQRYTFAMVVVYLFAWLLWLAGKRM